MMSDYEIKILKELRRGKSDPEKISNRTGLPMEIVEAIIREYRNDFQEYGPRKKIQFTKDSIALLIDIVILYVFIRLVIAIVG